MDLDDIVKCIVARNEAVLPYVIKWYSGRLIARIYRKVYWCGTRQDAEDMAFETIWMVWTEISKFDRKRGNFEQWLYYNADKLAQKFLRREQRRKAISENFLQPVFADLLAASSGDVDARKNLLLLSVKQELAFLEAEMQDIFILHYGDQNLTIKEIAQLKGLPEGSIKRKLHEVRKLLEEKIRE